MAEQKRKPAHLGSIPLMEGEQIYVSVSPEGMILLVVEPGHRQHVLEDGPALVLGTMLQLAVQVGQAAKLRHLQALGTSGIPRA